MFIEWLLAFALGFVAYTYVGYPLLLALLVAARFGEDPVASVRVNPALGGGEVPVRGTGAWPTVTLLVAAWNEQDHVAAKVQNTRELRYPDGKLRHVWVTDGSDDDTVSMLRECVGVRVFHEDRRGGKGAALNRVLPLLDTDIVVFSDANAMYSPDAIHRLVRHFRDPRVGGVSGEKRVAREGFVSGEGFYWTYESWLKANESSLHSVMGSAGEIFAIRRELFQPVPHDAVIEDFELTMGLVARGWRNLYEPEAVAVELPCADSAGDFERRARITAGGCKAVLRLRMLADPSTYGWVAFTFLSHRVFRWWLAPAFVIAAFPLNIAVVALTGGLAWWATLLAQTLLIGLALTQHRLRRQSTWLRIPHFFYLANASALMGIVRFLRGSQAVTWARVPRATESNRRSL